MDYVITSIVMLQEIKYPWMSSINCLQQLRRLSDPDLQDRCGYNQAARGGASIDL
jgi:hypothetical protein